MKKIIFVLVVLLLAVPAWTTTVTVTAERVGTTDQVEIKYVTDTNLQDLLPDLANKIAPSPAPSFPASFKAFNPPVSTQSVSSSAPAFAEWTKNNEPGDTMALTGSNLGPEFTFYTEGVRANGKVQLLKDMQAAVTLPMSLRSNEFMLLWNKNASGYSRPVIINGTCAWWLGPNKVGRGETFSIFGQNLNLSGSSYAYIEGYGWLTSLKANPYKSDFKVPANLENGQYQVWAHNGLGRGYGWGRPQTLTVYNGMVWNNNPATWYNVKAYGAKGDGITNDHDAIEDAIEAANKVDGATVYFPEGVYAVGDKISFSSISKLRLLGAGKTKTVLRKNPGNISYLLKFALVESEISRMTLETGDYDAGNSYLLYFRNSSDALLTNLKISQLPGAQYKTRNSIIEFLGDDQLIKMYDCDVIAQGVLGFGNAPQVFLDRVNVYGLNDINVQVSFKANVGVSVQNSTGQHYDTRDISSGLGWSKGRFVYSNAKIASARNWYFGENTTTDMTTRPSDDVDQNSSENFLFEASHTYFYGPVVSATANTVKLTSLFRTTADKKGMDYEKYMASITAGKGLGQSRYIIATNLDTNTITLSEPWQLAPDSSSKIMIGRYTSRVAVYKNKFDGMARDSLNETASTGIEAYGGCSELIADGNISTEQKSMFYVYSGGRPYFQDDFITMEPTYFNVYKNNRADTCYCLARIVVSTPRGDKSSDDPNPYYKFPHSEDAALLGNVYRNNAAENITAGVWRFESRVENQYMQMSVFENNTASNFGDYIDFRHYLRSTIEHTLPSYIVDQLFINEENK